MSAQLSRDDWKGRIGGLSYRNQAFIGGKFAPSLTGKTFDCINPATGQVLTKVAACEQADVDRRGQGRARRVRQGHLGQHAAGQAQAHHAEARRADDEEPRGAGAARDARHGQADRRTRPRSTSRARPTRVQWFAEAIDKIYDEVAPTPGNVRWP